MNMSIVTILYFSKVLASKEKMLGINETKKKLKINKNTNSLAFLNLT